MTLAQLSLCTIGVMVNVKREEVLCRARLLYALCDLPAKAALFNVIQYNGKYGCPSCTHPGEQVQFIICLIYMHDGNIKIY